MKLQIENRIQAAVYAVRSGSSRAGGGRGALAQRAEQGAQALERARRPSTSRRKRELAALGLRRRGATSLSRRSSRRRSASSSSACAYPVVSVSSTCSGRARRARR